MSVDDWVKIIGAAMPVSTAFVGLAGAGLGAWVTHKHHTAAREFEERRWRLENRLRRKEDAIFEYAETMLTKGIWVE